MKRSERKDRMRERILTAAVERYKEVSLEAIKMRDLARSIGISTATLYNYFSSKEKLSKAVVLHMLASYQQTLINYLNDPSLTFPEILQRMQLSSKQIHNSVPEKLMDLIFKMYQDNEIYHMFDSQSDFWRQFVARGRADGYIADDLSNTTVYIYIDMFFQYFRNPEHLEKLKITPQLLKQIDHELDTMFLRGLLGAVRSIKVDDFQRLHTCHKAFENRNEKQKKQKRTTTKSQ
ncbi:TetR/AcrR family transcriptional regulator [Sporolactobacillus shoreicorticis]|uniref:TetR/AcrR family transcriptional regulator n=1 Tax=Sporolactobacillus shoreicorticis TaxID=1923877 RepID=A0ABW5S120_9BACL|nr:TetR/AcrR family transcriptional regulator [Sporolactobacillus shoreicorticis]MCO7128097.1 TetR/AcrR family transcriptional regulator [Sporolactobacillus shoreicorticis]